MTQMANQKATTGAVKNFATQRYNKLCSTISTGESLPAELGRRRAGDCEDSLQRGMVWRAGSERVRYSNYKYSLRITLNQSYFNIPHVLKLICFLQGSDFSIENNSVSSNDLCLCFPDRDLYTVYIMSVTKDRIGKTLLFCSKK